MGESFAIDTHSESVLRTSARHMAAQIMATMTDAVANQCGCTPCATWRDRYKRVVLTLEEWLGDDANMHHTLTGQSREHWVIELSRERVDPRLGSLALCLLHVVGERLARTEAGREHDAGYALLYYALTNEDRARRLWLSLPTRAEVLQEDDLAARAAVGQLQREKM
jgi:hypothetical protein